MTKREIAACIDHTFLKAAGDPDAVERLCAEAKKYHFACAMVWPIFMFLKASCMPYMGA